MNKQRRNKLSIANNYIKEAKNIVKNVQSEEEYTYDNIPENLQCSERGYNIEDNINNLEEIIEKIDEITELIDDIIF